jgi:hypothetical protein
MAVPGVVRASGNSPGNGIGERARGFGDYRLASAACCPNA